VMNEQRKVIYQRRDQILEGADLKAAAAEYLREAINDLVETHCASAATDEWDLDGLVAETALYWPTVVSASDLADLDTAGQVSEVLVAEALGHYEQREAELGEEVMRQVERQVMLRIIDQRWREHLEEMDYLQEGINLRAMGQKDPLVEWQREGFQMFGSMMTGIARDFVRYVMHVQVAQQEAPQLTPQVFNMQQSSSDDAASDGFASARAAAVAESTGAPVPTRPETSAKPQTVVKDAFDKTPRNAPCPCGSGKKFKACHGAA
jgi:preprotein translocase subunit SecA